LKIEEERQKKRPTQEGTVWCIPFFPSVRIWGHLTCWAAGWASPQSRFMTDEHSDAASVAPLPAAPPAAAPLTAATSVLVLDRKMVQALFAALRTSVPSEVQQTLVRDSLEELKFLIARQPRLSSFHHRRRESLRHPALAMATKNYYQLCRRKRIDLAVRAVAAEQQQERQPSTRGTAQDGQADGTDVVVAQRESELVDILLAEYAQSGGFQEDYGRFGHHGNSSSTTNNGNLGESARFSTSASFGSRGISAQLVTSVSAMDIRSEASLSMGESRGGTAAFAEAGNTSFSCMSGVWRSDQSILNRGSASPGNHATLADSTGIISLGRLGQSFTGGNNVINDAGAGHPRSAKGTRSATGGAGRFFSKRHDGTERGGASARGGGGRGGGAGRWGGAEMLAMVVRRAEEELKVGSGGDAYLLTSSRPVEILLTCYGGVPRDSAAMAMGAASLLMGVDNFSVSTSTATPAGAEQLYNAVVEEDARWDRLAQCYRQLLREANAVRQAAAAAVAQDPLVNDIIHRFWERLTVSAAAQQAYKAQEANQKRDAAAVAASFSKRVHSHPTADGADEDDLDEIQHPTDEKQEGFAGGGGWVGGVGTSRSGTRSGPRSAKDTADGASRKGTKGGGKGKKKSAAVAAFAAKAAEPAPTVAYYMTPLQYVYLHTRLAHILLPDSNALDMELLYFIQEDLLVDAAYSESDAAQTLYFGEAPRLVSLNGAGGVESERPRHADRRRGNKDRFATWPEDEVDASAGGEGRQKGSSQHQRFLAVRRHGYAFGGDGSGGGGATSRQDDKLSVLVRHPTAVNFSRGSGASDDGPAASSHRGGNNNCSNKSTSVDGKGDAKETVKNALPLVNMCFSSSQLPSLTFQQFWCSMMELADNWTCCAGHPVETAIFLWELYAEVFGHNWGGDDEALVTALEEKTATVSKAERARIDEEVADALKSFHDLVQALRARERANRPSSTKGLAGGLNAPLSENVSFLPGGGTKRRGRHRGCKKDGSQLIVELEKTYAWDSSSSSDSDLSLTEWNALVADEHRSSGEWVYAERVGEDGVKRRFRRRVMHRQSRQRTDASDPTKKMSLHPALQGDNGGELSFVLEEELDKDGAVVKQRKRRCKEVAAAQSKQRNESSSGPLVVTTTSLYERHRRYDEDNAKQLRRLEPRRRVGTGSSRTSSMTSWSSIDDGTTEDRRNGQRRRRRIRRTGPRRDRLPVKAASIGDGDGEDEGASASLLPPSPATHVKKGSAKTDGKTSDGRPAPKSSLTSEELAELQANKDWLCSVLGSKEIFLPPHMFDDPAEQLLLYELLRLAKESEARGSSSGTDGLFNIGDGEASGETDLSRLAALLAQSAAFNLDGLDDSALMRRLLGEGKGGSSKYLSPQQLQSILLVLAEGQPSAGGADSTAVTETEGMRRRRLHLLHMLEERRAREMEELSKADASDATLPPPKKKVNPATDAAITPTPPVTLPLPVSRPGSIHPLPLPSPVHSGGADVSTTTTNAAADLSAAQRTSSPPSPKPKLNTTGQPSEGAEWVLSPATAAERREQERLFHELEAYWVDRASKRGRYRVHIIEYTKEQLNEFFAHLHLGSRQRALLRGRAPLAGATSLVGGTLHQDTPPTTNTTASNAGHRGNAAKAAATSSSSSVPFTATPVKLFTLTTETSLDNALRESYQSYLSDKAFSRSCKDGAPRTDPPSHPPGLPPLSQSGRASGKSAAASAYRDSTARQPTTAAAVAAAGSNPAAPPGPQTAAKLLPPLSAPEARRHQPPSSARPPNLLPRV
jgi:hypothetical protein